MSVIVLVKFNSSKYTMPSGSHQIQSMIMEPWISDLTLEMDVWPIYSHNYVLDIYCTHFSFSVIMPCRNVHEQTDVVQHLLGLNCCFYTISKAFWACLVRVTLNNFAISSSLLHESSLSTVSNYISSFAMLVLFVLEAIEPLMILTTRE